MPKTLLEQIRNMQKRIKEKSPQEIPLKEVSWSEIAPALINEKPTKRLMIIAVSRGCEWAKKATGPCTMCNFWYVCSKKATTDKIVYFFKKEIGKFNFEKEGIEEIDIFNSGSFLNDREMPKEARLRLFKIVSRIDLIKKVMIESRPEYRQFC
jgi:radical SAM enzyme (TIGR01210 family)